MDDQDSIREWLKHLPDRLLAAESGRRNNKRLKHEHGLGGVLLLCDGGA
jgi:hypothetical protein